ncbi:hypothetical protein KI688_010420 [Linnemannia hyalina]|uniref:F-box domain-containing protein n=1 Tax=Linnemannia hyalina TaxID=64524 RepID=A0A9P7XZM5_9FUNG|nr:hypothetical protein KI688_010420 [Linnemannia hyalina]
MSDSPLPLECLQGAIKFLSDNLDIHSLTVLLRVNRFFAEATLPFLYADPFCEHFSILEEWTDRRSLILVRTLLRQVPLDDLTPLLRTFYFDSQNFDCSSDPLSAEVQEPYTPVLIYLPHVRSLFSDNFPTCKLPCGHLAAILKTVGLYDQYAVDDLYGGVDPDYSDYFVAHAFKEDVRRQLGWALCVPELVQTLSIAVSDCGRYLERVERFARLTSVRFSFDKQHEFGRDWVERMTPEAKARELEFREERRVHLETMVQFVREHTQIHKGVLRHAICENGYHLQETRLLCQICPEEYQLALLDCLPPLYNPKVLDTDNLRQFAFKFQETNLEFVEEFENVYADEQTMDLLETKGPFLHRCRALRKVDIVAFGDRDIFEWAVLEKQEYDRLMNRDEVPERPLVQAEHVKIQFDQECDGLQIDSIAHGFSNTLESLSVEWATRFSSYSEPAQEPVAFGQLWHLPRLRTLSVNTKMAHLFLDPEALLGCPNVQEITLVDWMTDHTLTGLQLWKHACLPELTSLKMNGTAARTFHPNTLHSSPKLEVLHIGIGTNTGIDDIPDISDILHLLLETGGSGDEQAGAAGGASPAELLTFFPRWSWDWYMPCLRELFMTAEYALCFQFRMLRETPNLETLSLDMQTTVYMDVHELERHEFSLDDLRENDSNNIHSNDSNDEKKSKARLFIKLPKLINLQLIGTWIIGHEFWETAFEEVMPNLLSVQESKCRGFDKQDWVSALSVLPRLLRAYSSRHIWSDDPELELTLKDLGLMEKEEGNGEEKERREGEEDDVEGVYEQEDEEEEGIFLEANRGWRPVMYGFGREPIPGVGINETEFRFEHSNKVYVRQISGVATAAPVGPVAAAAVESLKL